MCGRLKHVQTASQAVENPLRLSDLVPLRRMLGQDSIVIRVYPDGSFAPFEQMPMLFFDRPLRRALGDGMDANGRFAKACREAVKRRRSVSLRPDASSTDEILINPILDNDGPAIRFLVCWTRHTDVLASPVNGLAWPDLGLDAVVTRYRLRSDERSDVVEAAPWWALGNGELLELWPHHTHVSAMGLGHAVIEMLIMNAAEAAAELGGGPAVRIEVPSADMLTGLVPVVHGTLRASGLAPDRLILAIDVDLAVDPDLLPIIVHLRTMGALIDIVGLDALTSTLHTVSDTSNQPARPVPAIRVDHGPWVADFTSATHTVAA